MSKKLLVSHEQIKAIKWLQSEGYTVDEMINAQNCKWIGKNTACLNKLSSAEMAKILYTDDYEIEKPKFKIGDYVVIDYGEHGQVFSRIKNWINKETGTFYVEAGHVAGDSSNARLANPEDIYWLETLKRTKINDFKIGDVIKRDGCGDGVMPVVEELEDGLTIEEAIELTKNEDFLGIYPVESFKPFYK